ncbi:transposase [Aerococcaceae bacterium zg-ZUI334]|uniref:transposase n=1 Tax=Aerococcaceae bacterium zg-252 TaxID=2796928 RepID=UPI001B9474D9|nr:transposase [Aerococcaceae bacterium zg-ZUI334]
MSNFWGAVQSCIDSFHVIKNLNDSLDKIRILIMNQYHSDSIEYYLLKNWKYLLFDRKSDFHNFPQYNRKLKRFSHTLYT